MNRQDNTTVRKGLWNFIDRIEGDKVVWVIVFMLLMISWLAIFSSTPLLALEMKTDRLSIMKEQIFITALGIFVIFVLYSIRKVGILRWFSKLGFAVSFGLLLILDTHANLGITQIFLYFLALLGVSRESGNHTNLLLVSLGEIGGIGVRFTWGSRESGNHANLLLVSFREIGGIGVRFT